MLFYCWASVVDGGPTLKQCWVIASFLNCIINSRDVLCEAVECSIRFTRKYQRFFNMTLGESDLDPKVRKMSTIL